MSQLSRVMRDTTENGLVFWCPGCDCAHVINHGPGHWFWNGDVDKPTFTPSVKVSAVEFTEKGEADLKQWREGGCGPRNGVGFEHVDTICHSFVTDGRIQFLGDCTHALANQTVDLPEWNWDTRP